MTLAATLAADPRRCPAGFDLATQHPALCRCCDPAPVAPASEWQTFLTALRSSVREGEVSVNVVRPKVRGRIKPEHIGQFWKDARRQGYIGHLRWEDSTDIEGGNSDKQSRVYRWLGGAA